MSMHLASQSNSGGTYSRKGGKPPRYADNVTRGRWGWIYPLIVHFLPCQALGLDKLLVESPVASAKVSDAQSWFADNA